MAGFDTSVNLIASSTLALLTHPRRRPGCGRTRRCSLAAIKELLRFTSPVNHANDRFTTEDLRTVSLMNGLGSLPVRLA